MNSSTAKLRPAAALKAAPTPSPAERARRRWLTASADRTRDVTAALFARHRSLIVARLQALGLTPSDAEDLCTDVFIVALRRLDTYQGTASLCSWLLGIARKLASDHRRSARCRHETLVDELPEHGAFESPDSELEAKERTTVLQRHIDALKPGPRAVVKKFVLQEQAMDAVARSERVPLQTAYARLYAAHTALRASLEGAL